MLTLKQALEVIKMAESKANELGINVTISVYDTSGNPIALHRMDGALSVSPTFANAKAFTSGTLGLPTSDIAKYAEPGSPYFGINHLDGGKLTTIAGGYPLKIEDTFVGGIGVGGSYDTAQDDEIAQAGATALK